MKRAIIIIILLLLLGCAKENISQEMCSIFKNSGVYENLTFIYDEGVCIIETKDYVDVYLLACSGVSEEYNIIIKTGNTDETNIIRYFNDNMNWKIKSTCDFSKLN